MHKVRITILKTTFDSELAREYGAAGLGPCPMMNLKVVQNRHDTQVKMTF